jgi:excinuclease ABC subunit A
VREHAFEGVLPNLERRYRETDSVVVREELARYRNTQTCMECGGTRLRREARHVKVAERTNYEVSALPLRKAFDFFKSLSLAAPSSRSPSASCARSPTGWNSSSTSASTIWR